ncbi:MAG: hypothetical protein V1765_02230 [bacterium]
MRHIIFSKLLFVLFFGSLIIFLGGCSEDIVTPDNKVELADSVFIPLDCPIWQKYESTVSNNPEYRAIQPWLHAVTSQSNVLPDSQSWVEIKPLSAKFIEVYPDNQEKVIILLSDEYGATPQRPLEINEGGLFSRWYQDNTFDPLINSVYNYQANSLKFFVGLQPDKVSHWWFNPRGKYNKRDDCSYVVELEVRINGNACLQVSADFYKTTSSSYPDNKEAGHSNWFAATNGWKKIRFKVCRGL